MAISERRLRQSCLKKSVGAQAERRFGKLELNVVKIVSVSCK